MIKRNRADRPSDDELLARVQAAVNDTSTERSAYATNTANRRHTEIAEKHSTWRWVVITVTLVAVAFAVWSWFDKKNFAPKRLEARLENERKDALRAARSNELVAAGPKVSRHERQGATVWIIDIPSQSTPEGYVSWNRCIALSLVGSTAISCEGHAGNSLNMIDFDPVERGPTDLVPR